MIPVALQQHVDDLKKRGRSLSIHDHAGQCYVQADDIAATAPPWDRTVYSILVAIPALYPQGALDAFYLALPHTYNNAKHERVSGTVLDLGGKQWQLVSWHYLDGKPWTADKDSLESHLVHCAGFFLARGVRG